MKFILPLMVFIVLVGMPINIFILSVITYAHTDEIEQLTERLEQLEKQQTADIEYESMEQNRIAMELLYEERRKSLK